MPHIGQAPGSPALPDRFAFVLAGLRVNRPKSLKAKAKRAIMSKIKKKM